MGSRVSMAEIESWRTMRASGMSDREIAEQAGRSPNTVGNKLRAALASSPFPARQPDDHELHLMYGETLEEEHEISLRLLFHEHPQMREGSAAREWAAGHRLDAMREAGLLLDIGALHRPDDLVDIAYTATDVGGQDPQDHRAAAIKLLTDAADLVRRRV